MKKVPILMFFLLMFLCAVQPVQAHSADMYSHAIYIQLTASGISLHWEVQSGPMIASWLWNQVDANQDGNVSQDEADAWGASQASFLVVTLDGSKFPLKLDKVVFPSQLSDMQAGTSYPVLYFSADWPQGMRNGASLTIHNSLDEANSLNWFEVSTQGAAAFQSPQQKTSTLNLVVVRNGIIPAPAWDRGQGAQTGDLLTTWDSNTPILQSNPGASTGWFSGSAQEILVGLVKQDQYSLSFIIFALGISLALGALHALTPGHGKTVVAAYLVGARGSSWHAVVLGSVVTLTHTGSVLVLGLITLVASRYILSNNLIPVMEGFSGLLIVGLGVYLLVQRLHEWQHNQAHLHGYVHDHLVDYQLDHDLEHLPHEHEHEPHQQGAEHSHEHGHSHAIPETLTWRSLIALGVSGGLVPCPDAIAILLVAIAINRVLLGLALIVSFSLGLAIVLISIGLVMVHSRRLFDRLDAFQRFAPAMPVVSALVVLILGAALTYSSAGQVLVAFGSKTSAFPLNQARIFYLAPGLDGHDQIFVTGDLGQNHGIIPVPARERMLTAAALEVSDYAVSPSGTQLIYFPQNDNFENDIWLMNQDGTQNRQVGICQAAACRQPVWSPDGQNVIYESTSLGSGNLQGIPTLWLLNVNSGQTKPVFQDSNLPVINPRWSPDGKWLSYATAEGIRLYRPESGESRLIGNRINSEADWSMDSQSLLLRDNVDIGDSYVMQVFRYDLNSQKLSPFYADMGMDTILVAVSPDGEWAALVKSNLMQPITYKIWLVRMDGSQQRELASASHGIYDNLSWSPDGKYLLYDFYVTNASTPETRLQIIDVNTAQVHDLGPGSNPRWTWNGSTPSSNAQ